MNGDLREAAVTVGDSTPTVAADDRPEPAAAATGTSISGTRRRSRRRTWLLLLAIPTAVAVVLGLGVGIAAWQLQRNVDAKINRFGDPFKALPDAARPQPVAVPAVAADGPHVAMNLLVFGSDSRISAGDPTQWEAGAQRTDAIMLAHIPADRSGAYVMSIPRDSWVNVPGHGMAKINAAFSWGGPSLAIATIEQLTGVRIDHMVITDFTGFARITDLLGGVEITVPKTTHGYTGGQGDNFKAGTYTMDGATALTYVRQRYNLPNGDFDRVKRQQNWIRSILRAAATSGAATDPQKLFELLGAVASSLSTDSGFTIGEMRDLAWSLRHTGVGGAHFLTVPVAGTGWSPDHKQSIVLLDKSGTASLWAAVRADKVSGWLADHDDRTLTDTVS